MRYSLSARILETKELTENIKVGIRPDFEEFAVLAHDCGFDGVNLRFWQIAPEIVSDSEVYAIKETLKKKNLEVYVIQGAICKEFIERAKILGAKKIQAIPKNMNLVSDDMRVAMQIHSGGDFESIADCVKSFATKYNDPRIGIFPEPGNLQLVGEKFTEDMFLPLKDRILGYFFQSLEVGFGEISLAIKNGQKVKVKRVAPWENTQFNMPLFSKAIKKCAAGDFFNINEPPPANHKPKEFLLKTLDFIKTKFNTEYQV